MKRKCFGSKCSLYVCGPAAAGGAWEGGRREGCWLSDVLSEAGLMTLKPGRGALCQLHVPHSHTDHFSRESYHAADNAMVHTPARQDLFLFLLLSLCSLA